jgi:anti-anti-sigma factor
MHTFRLLGELDRASAITLEWEIERACEAGASGITLDLSGLTHIDATGIAVIAFRRGWCERRGCAFVLTAGSAPVERAIERTGTSDVLASIAAKRAQAAAARTAPAARGSRGGGGAAKRRLAREARAAAVVRSSSVLHLSGHRDASEEAPRRRGGRP